MSIYSASLLFAAAVIAGALNSVAGGGSFLSFPALMFAGIAPKIANATNTVALWPGSVASVWAYKKELTARRAELISLGTVSLIGGILGALLLLKTPERTFVQILPFLLLAATLLFSYGGRISKAIRAKMGLS